MYNNHSQNKGFLDRVSEMEHSELMEHMYSLTETYQSYIFERCALLAGKYIDAESFFHESLGTFVYNTDKKLDQCAWNVAYSLYNLIRDKKKEGVIGSKDSPFFSGYMHVLQSHQDVINLDKVQHIGKLISAITIPGSNLNHYDAGYKDLSEIGALGLVTNPVSLQDAIHNIYVGKINHRDNESQEALFRSTYQDLALWSHLFFVVFGFYPDVTSDLTHHLLYRFYRDYVNSEDRPMKYLNFINTMEDLDCVSPNYKKRYSHPDSFIMSTGQGYNMRYYMTRVDDLHPLVSVHVEPPIPVIETVPEENNVARCNVRVISSTSVDVPAGTDPELKSSLEQEIEEITNNYLKEGSRTLRAISSKPKQSKPLEEKGFFEEWGTTCGIVGVAGALIAGGLYLFGKSKD